MLVQPHSTTTSSSPGTASQMRRKGEEMRPVFEEAGAEGGPDERAGGQGAGQGEAKRRRVEHGQRAAAVSGSPEGAGQSQEGSSAEKKGGGDDAGGEKGDADDEQESGRGMTDSDDDKPLGLRPRKAEVKAEKKQKDDESDEVKPLGTLKKESEDEAELGELHLRVREGGSATRLCAVRSTLSGRTSIFSSCVLRNETCLLELALSNSGLTALPSELVALTG
jgi:hypothetical protein